jgi:fatty acid desaturase
MNARLVVPGLDRQAVRSVPWKDLVCVSGADVVWELTLSVPWLAGSLAAAAMQWWLVGLACSFMFFLTGLRQAHNAHHYTLGISRRATEWVMLALSMLMLGSMHAVQVNHLRHHRFCLGDNDLEARSARMPWWKALLFGPIFPLLLHHAAWKYGNRHQKKWIALELLGNIAVLTTVFLTAGLPWLRYHFIAMSAGQCLTSFFAVWTVHHHCDTDGVFARTVRNRIKARLTYNMFFHIEHHLFPAVPTSRLHILASRLDAVAPELAGRKVF